MSARKSIEQSYDPALEGTGLASGSYKFARRVMTLLVNTTMRREWIGMEHIPKTGPVLVAVNHIGHADPACVALFVNDSGRHPRFMAKAELMKFPGLTYLMNDTGQIPVYRDTREAGAALVNAVKRLEADGCVVVYPEGTITKDPDLWPMRARTGIARLFLATGAPVVPLAQWGPNHLRRHWRPWRRVLVRMAAGPALDLDRFKGKAATPQLLDEITDLVIAALRDGVSKLREEPVPSVIWDNRRKTHVPADRSDEGDDVTIHEAEPKSGRKSA